MKKLEEINKKGLFFPYVAILSYLIANVTFSSKCLWLSDTLKHTNKSVAVPGGMVFQE